MRYSVLQRNGLVLLRGAAVFVAAGIATGCSQQVARFGGGVDGVFTASTANQRQIIKPGNQPFPSEAPSAAPAAAAADGSHAGSVRREALAPVSAAYPAASEEPIESAAREKRELSAAANTPRPREMDGATAAGVRKPRAAPIEAEGDPKGWSRAGGTQVTVKDGETVHNLSRRFGVPAKVIMKVNGLTEADGLQVGQKIVIPTYVYSSKAPVSAPDSDPKTAAAKSSRGQRDPGDEAPKPGDKLAVLPAAPKTKEGEAAAKPETEGKTAQAKPAARGAYTVASGDTLSRIAKKHGVSTAALKRANGLEDGVLKIGQTLKIPGSPAPAVADASPGPDPVTTGSAGPAKPAKATEIAGYTPPKRSIEEVGEDDTPAPNATGIGRMRWPVRGKVISAYGKAAGKANDGIDIAVPEGTPVKAAENGVVIYAGDGLKEFGNTVLVRHENGLVTVYGHASKLAVTRGDKVKRGQEIAVSGMSGSTDAPKLHFEVRKNSAPVDPATYLE